MTMPKDTKDRTASMVADMLQEGEAVQIEGLCNQYFRRGHRFGYAVLTDRRFVLFRYHPFADLIHPVRYMQKTWPRPYAEIPLEELTAVESKRSWKSWLVTVAEEDGTVHEGLRFPDEEDRWLALLAQAQEQE